MRSVPGGKGLPCLQRKTLVESSQGFRRFGIGTWKIPDYGFLPSPSLPSGSEMFPCCSGRSSFIGCEKIKRFGDGSSGGLDGGISFQRRRNSISLAYSLPVKLAQNSHVCRHVLEVGEIPLRKIGGVVAVAAIHGENLAARQRVLVGAMPFLFARRGLHAPRGRALRLFGSVHGGC
jgi:hypothetical protein